VLDADAFLGQGKIRRYQLLIAALCAGMLIVDGYNVAVLSFVAPILSDELQISRAELGPVLVANTL
jgi:AAHS family 4-hydroxybenzoate transporter-like MFS transporter